MAGLTYATYQTQLAQLAVVDPLDSNFQTILPEVIEYAELRMCRDLDFLSTVASDTSVTTTANNRSFSFALPLFVTIQQVNVITPTGTSNPSLGTRVQLTPVTKEVIDALYPSSTSADVPKFFAMQNQNTVLLGPWPDDTYTIELVGTQRPATLSASNTTTFISTYLPDVFLMASMVYISAFQRNFSAMSDDPAMGATYEKQYQTLLQGATVEEARKKFQSGAWSSMSPAVVATPTRG